MFIGTTFSASINGWRAFLRLITPSSVKFGIVAFILAPRFAFAKYRFNVVQTS